MNPSLDAILNRRRIIITCGTGGVGKTTLSAAIAVRAALLGKRTVVITIDPAKRLAHSLGLEKLGDQPTDLTELLRKACRKLTPDQAAFTGTLEAIVPDTRHTFESFVHSIALSSASAEQVMRNPIFEIFAKEFSGTNEYMALERLYTLSLDLAYDCIVLDTAPSRNTLSFLDAPNLLARLFEEKLIHWLAVPTNKLVAAGMKKVLTILEKMTGATFMTSLLEFSAGLMEMQANFSSNLRKVMTLLRSEEVGAIMVTHATPETGPEVRHFIETLAQRGIHFDGIAINRLLGPLGEADESSEASALVAALQKREALIVEPICVDLGRSKTNFCAQLPELARDIHSVEDLLHVALALASDHR